jgi:glycosyltransferase involved in cell wall biosynthesis
MDTTAKPVIEPTRVLIITYYWPPSGGSGVQRWLKMSKYLPAFGWEPWIFTPENPAFTVRDESLSADVPPEAEVIRFPIWEPYRLYYRIGKWLGRSVETPADQISTGKKSFFQSASAWIRGNFFVPDARAFWVKPSAGFLEGLITQNGIRHVITTGPPHSLHLIGLELKKRIPSITWLADFRDPWSEWNLLDTLSLSAWSRMRHVRLERKVLAGADVVLTIGPYFVDRFQKLGAHRVELLTNGFDESDFRDIPRKRSEYLTIRHTGIVDELRDPRPFFEALKEAGRQQPSLLARIRVEFIGHVNAALRAEVEEDAELHNLITFCPPVPHKKLLELYGETDLMLLILGNNAQALGNLPGKFFEYLATGNPILAVGPTDGDTATILRETGAGRLFTRFDKQGLAAAILELYDQWKQGSLSSLAPPPAYSRRSLAGRLASILKSEP